MIDAAQGIEAQTLANYHLALEQNLIDHPGDQQDRLAGGRRAARPPRDRRAADHRRQRRDRRPAPRRGSGSRRSSRRSSRASRRRSGTTDHLRGLVFDAQFDPYRGVVAYVRVVDGELRSGMKFMSMAHQRVYEATEVGVFKPEMRKTDVLTVGNVGYVIANIKSLGDMDVGDTITAADNPAPSRCPATSRSSRWSTAGSTPTKGVEVSDLARRAREARAQRLGAALRAGELDRAGLRLPLRLLGPLAHGDRARAAGAQLQPRPDRDVALGRLSRDADRRHDRADRQPGEAAAARPDRADGRAVRARQPSSRRPSTSARSWSSRKTGAARCRTWSTSPTAA